MEEQITSPSNKLIKEVRGLHRKKERWKRKKYFIEGIRFLKEGLQSNAKIQYILYTDDLSTIRGGKALLDAIKQRGYTLYKISDALLKEISDTENPQGVLAVVEMTTPSFEELLDSNHDFLILLDGVQDPGNLGTMIRTADAFGVTGIIAGEGCVDMYNPKALRSTMGSVFHIPVLHSKNLVQSIEALKARGIKVIATGLETEAYVHEMDFVSSVGLIIGNEALGVSEACMNVADGIVKIPMSGNAESLNAAIAAGVLMYEASRQRRKI